MNTDEIIELLVMAQENIPSKDDRNLCMRYEDAIYEIKRLAHALEESVKLQSHYAQLLNSYDGGERIGFDNGEAWLKRLDEIKAKK
jgi:hypothetical protein